MCTCEMDKQWSLFSGNIQLSGVRVLKDPNDTEESRMSKLSYSED